MENLLSNLLELLAIYGIKAIAALAILIIGRWAAKMVEKIIHNVMEKRRIDPTLISFTTSLVYFGLLIFIVIAALSQVGIQTTSFIAILGAAGLAIGLALQGSLSNFAAGFLLIVYRPFKVGNFIEAAGTAGTVEKIQIFTTQLTTADNKTIIVPNSKLTDGNIVNWSLKGTRRVDMTVGIGKQNDLDKAKAIIRHILENDPRVLKDPAPVVAVLELAESSVKLAVRPWVKADDYGEVFFDTLEAMKKQLHAEGF